MMPAKERLPWFPCFQSKLLGALAGMGPDCGYAYTVILLRTYEVGGACPDSPQVLSRRTGMSVKRIERAIVWLLEEGKIRRTDVGLENPYATEVLEGREKVHIRLSRAGKSGGEKSAEKRKQNQKIEPTQASPKPKPASSKLELRTQIKIQKIQKTRRGAR